VLTAIRAGAAGNFLASMDQISPNAFKTVIDIDLLGSYNTVKATLPYIVKSAAIHKSNGKTGVFLFISSSKISILTSTAHPKGTGGRIIFVSATMHYTGSPLQAHVTSAKAAVDQLAWSVCIEQGPRGVTSNVISPGPIAGTEGMERLSTTQDGSAAKHIPSGRWGHVKEIADATVYLFSDTGNYVNGEILVGMFCSVFCSHLTSLTFLVDGGAWHTHFQPGAGQWVYPDFLLADQAVTGVKGGKPKL
jgi:peroxisomal 2,4-dienoyl-CoA reductase